MQKEQTIDHALRATWQAVAKMYNEQAVKFDSTMAMAFVLLTIDKENGTPSTALGPKMGMEPTSLSRILKSMDFVAWSLQLMVHAKLVTLKKIRHTESMSNSTEKAIKFAPRVSMTTANADLSIWLTLIIQLQRRIPMVIEIF